MLVLRFKRNSTVVELKFVCPTDTEVKQTETSEFGAEKRLLIESEPMEKMRDLSLSQIHLTGRRLLKATFGVRVIGGMTFF